MVKRLPNDALEWCRKHGAPVAESWPTGRWRRSLLRNEVARAKKASTAAAAARRKKAGVQASALAAMVPEHFWSAIKAPFVCAAFWLAVVSLGCSSRPDVDRAVFEPVYRAAKALESTTKEGTNSSQLHSLITTFSTELGIAKDRARTETEKKLLTEYDAAVGPFRDSLTVMEYQVRLGHMLVIGDHQLFGDLVRRYSLTVTTADAWLRDHPDRVYRGSLLSGKDRTSTTVIGTDETLAALWELGQNRLEGANGTYLNAVDED